MIFLLLVALIAPQDQKPEMRLNDSQIARFKELTESEIARLESLIPALKANFKKTKRAKINKRFDKPVRTKRATAFPSREEKNAAIKSEETRIGDNEKKLEKLKSGKAIVFGDMPYPPEVGAIGIANEGSLLVVQVIDKKHFLGKLSHVRSSRRSVIPGQSYVDRVTKIVMINVDTKGMADDVVVDLPQTFRVAKTTTYATTSGASNTVFLLVPLTEKDIAQLAKVVGK